MWFSLVLVFYFCERTFGGIYKPTFNPEDRRSSSAATTASPKNVNPPASEEVKYPNRPHIIVLMSDDMSFNDVSFRAASQVLTPNIDALGYQGVILNRHYAAKSSTPSRAAFLTGKYPVNTGMQHNSIENCQPYGLPLGFKLLPEYLKQAGYRTHLVGKWHLGFARKAFIPTRRGFDTFFGFYTSAHDYYDNTSQGNVKGYDFRRNEDVTYEGIGEYSTYLFTNESLKIIRNHNPDVPLFLQTAYSAPHAASQDTPSLAPLDEIEKFNYIQDPDTRIFAATVSILDRGIGEIIQELGRKKMLSNSVILFQSDNGGATLGPYSTRTSSFPLRGQRQTLFDGALRVPAVFWSPMMEVRHGISNRLTHTTDWLPTFVAMSGIRPIEKLDGFDMWPTLMKNTRSPRTEIVFDIDPIDGFSSYYRSGWKYINGTTSNGLYDSWLGTRAQQPMSTKDYVNTVKDSLTWQVLAPFALRSLGSKTIKRIRKKSKINCQPKMPYASACDPLLGPCLFRIKDDPCELNNLANTYPEQVQIMAQFVEMRRKTSLYPVNLPDDVENCDPNRYNGTFTWWLDVKPEQSVDRILRLGYLENVSDDNKNCSDSKKPCSSNLRSAHNLDYYGYPPYIHHNFTGHHYPGYGYPGCNPWIQCHPCLNQRYSRQYPVNNGSTPDGGDYRFLYPYFYFHYNRPPVQHHVTHPTTSRPTTQKTTRHPHPHPHPPVYPYPCCPCPCCPVPPTHPTHPPTPPHTTRPPTPPPCHTHHTHFPHPTHPPPTHPPPTRPPPTHPHPTHPTHPPHLPGHYHYPYPYPWPVHHIHYPYPYPSGGNISLAVNFFLPQQSSSVPPTFPTLTPFPPTNTPTPFPPTDTPRPGFPTPPPFPVGETPPGGIPTPPPTGPPPPQTTEPFPTPPPFVEPFPTPPPFVEPFPTPPPFVGPFPTPPPFVGPIPTVPPQPPGPDTNNLIPTPPPFMMGQFPFGPIPTPPPLPSNPSPMQYFNSNATAAHLLPSLYALQAGLNGFPQSFAQNPYMYPYPNSYGSRKMKGKKFDKKAIN